MEEERGFEKFSQKEIKEPKDGKDRIAAITREGSVLTPKEFEREQKERQKDPFRWKEQA